MDLKELEIKVNALDSSFTSSAHTIQHRLFGFITTNIRSVQTITKYIEEILPFYIRTKKNYLSWETYTKKTLQKNKQKFKRLELSKILFRKYQDSKGLNDIGEKLFRINEKYGKEYLTFILYLYLLSGKYYGIENQPLVEIEKILHIYKGNILQDGIDLLNNPISYNRLLLGCIFYNPSDINALDISFNLFENKIDNGGIELLKQSIENRLSKRIKGAGGLINFKKEAYLILNYFLFKEACKKFIDRPNYENIIDEYINIIFENKINFFFKIKDKSKLKEMFLCSKNKIILKDIFEFTLKIKFDNRFIRKYELKDIKQQAKSKYKNKCFFDYFADSEEIKKAHELNYFKTKKGNTYLEAHHMIQLENSKFFNNDIDILENIIPVCPNCHRKLHNATPDIIKKMIKIYVDKSDKQERIKNGIFVDIETLSAFYGIESD